MSAIEREDVDRQSLAGPAIRTWRAHPGIRRAVEAAAWGYPDGEPDSGFRPLTEFFPDDLALSALAWAVVVDLELEAAMVCTRRALLAEIAAGR